MQTPPEEVNTEGPSTQTLAVPTRQPTAGRPQAASSELSLPLNFERHAGDLDGMLKRHEIRALVVYSRSGFFYDAGQPEGIYYEAMDHLCGVFCHPKCTTRRRSSDSTTKTNRTRKVAVGTVNWVQHNP
jgi:hypothetical protein